MNEKKLTLQKIHFFEEFMPEQLGIYIGINPDDEGAKSFRDNFVLPTELPRVRKTTIAYNLHEERKNYQLN